MALTAAAELGIAKFFINFIFHTKTGNFCPRCPSMLATGYAAFVVEVEDFGVNTCATFCKLMLIIINIFNLPNAQIF